MAYKKVIPFLILFAFSCNSRKVKNESKPGDSAQKVINESKPGNVADTILYADAGVVVPNLQHALGLYTPLADSKGLTFHSTGAGKHIWIDSVYRDIIGSKGLFMIARTVESVAAISYNGDSLKKVLINIYVLPSLRVTIEGDKRYSYIKVSDSIPYNGSIFRDIFYFKVDSSGRMLGYYSSAPSRKVNERHFNFVVSDSLCPDHLVIKEYYRDKDSLAKINL
jgi:hypothetical protein